MSSREKAVPRKKEKEKKPKELMPKDIKYSQPGSVIVLEKKNTYTLLLMLKPR